jgi:hypothetical protein
LGRKKDPPVDVFQERRVRRLLNEPLIKEKWPHVAKLILEFNYIVAPPVLSDFEPETIERGPENKAFFDFDCRYNRHLQKNCFQGGFDLTDIVSKIIESGKTETSGELICPGWRESSVRPFKCLLTLRYRIKVHYS